MENGYARAAGAGHYVLIGLAGMALAWAAPAHAQTSDAVYVKKDTLQATLDASIAALDSAVQLGPWLFIGPFDNPQPKDLGKAVDAKLPLEGSADIAAAWPGKGGGDLRWQPAESLKDGQVNDLSVLIQDTTYIMYLCRTIESPGEYELPAAMGHSAGMAVWINGQRVLSRGGTRKARLGDDPVTLRLRKGKNVLLVKIAQAGGEAGFAFSALSLGRTPRCQALLLARIARDFPPAEVHAFMIELDWKRQYAELAAQVRSRGQFKNVAAQTFRAAAGIDDADRDPADVVLRRTETLLDDLADLGNRRGPPIAPARLSKAQQAISQARAELDTLKAACSRIDIKAADQRQVLYTQLCRLRRKVALANPLLDFDQVLFVKRERNQNSEGLGHHMCDQFFGFNARNIAGGGVYVLRDPFSDTPSLRNLVAETTVENGALAGRRLDFGAFISPELSYDARTVLFAHSQADPKARRWSEERSYHIFSVGMDGSDLRQITSGAYNDFDPCFLPDGRIVFISERRGGFGRCHGRPVPVYTLHTMNADGSDITCISYHESNEWQPVINHDGMIVYTRWDYVDRHFNIAHHPWVTTPDGCDARAIHGNFPPNGNWPSRPQMEMDIRPIPWSSRYVATAAAHHGQAYGSLVIFDPNAFDDGAMGPLRRLTPDARFPESECDTRDQPYGNAWPLSEDYYLALWDPATSNFGLYLVDAFGNKELIYRDPSISCLGPIPVRPRPVPPVVPPIVPRAPAPVAAMPSTTAEMNAAKQAAPYSFYDPDRGWAKPYHPVPDSSEVSEVVVINVYAGKKAWPPGTRIQQLRIVEPLIKSTPSADGPMISVGGQSSARAVLGTVPVESDGSVRFLAPIQRPLLFQAIDQNGFAVQSMRSDTYVMRGTRLVCKGCHEPAERSPAVPPAVLALQKPPATITPDVDGTNPFNYPRLVQPVLDRHCVECHAKNTPKAPDLGRGTPEGNRKNQGWYPSYVALAKNFGFWYSNGDVSYGAFDGSNTTPGKFGAYGSKLYKLLQAGHYDVKLAPDDMHRLAIWLESNSAFYGDYQDTGAQAKGDVVKPVVE